MTTPSIGGFHLAFDHDFLNKAIAAIVSAAAAAAFSAGADALVRTLQSDPKYAVWAVVVTAVVSAISKKPTA